ETYAGIVFATWAKDAPSLDAYLGDARWYLDTLFNRRDGGMQALGPMKWLEPVNWKTLVDNCSDNYHVPTSHLSSAQVQSRYLGRPRLSHEDQFGSPNQHAFVNGHSITFRDADDNTPRFVHGMSKDTLELFQAYHEATMPEVERRLGTLRARRVQLGNHSIFPNGILGLRLALPRGPLKTEFWHFVLVERDMPDEIKRAIRIGSQANNGAAGMFEQDDVDNWRQVTAASTSRFGRRHPQDLSMGGWSVAQPAISGHRRDGGLRVAHPPYAPRGFGTTRSSQISTASMRRSPTSWAASPPPKPSPLKGEGFCAAAFGEGETRA